MIYPCILSGGSGTRLWPRSRNFAPKQLQALLSDRSMIRDTAMRFQGEVTFAAATVVCNETYAETIAEDFKNGEPKLSGLIAEPGRRDTAAAAALAAFHVKDLDPKGFVLLLPSDHHIRRPAAFASAIRKAAENAENVITTFGVVPSHPDTGFGYIRRNDEEGIIGEMYKVDAFVEKPDLATAQTYIDKGGYYWNAGIFLFKPNTLLDELRCLQPNIYKAVERSWYERKEKSISGVTVHVPSQSFLASDAISLDYAVMEKTATATVMPIDIGWDDLGSWSAMRNLHGPDELGNVSRGDALIFDCKNTYLDASSRLVVASGVSNLIVVDTDDALLICGGDASQSIKSVHSKLVKMGRKEADFHPDLTSRRVALRQWYRNWLLNDVMPLWSGAAINSETGLPYESLSYDGEPIDETLRTRVISRQIFTFAFASNQFAWDPTRAKTLISSLCDIYIDVAQSNPGSVSRLTRDGSIVDDRWDTYDQAFHILAMAWACRTTNEERYASLGQIALAELDKLLRHPINGFKEDSISSLPRRANPHMHLLEASLAWLPTPFRAMFSPLSEETTSLFHNHFCRSGLLFERFDDTLSIVKDPHSRVAVEPGHLYEWATLIKMAGSEGVKPELACKVAPMVAFADIYCQNANTGLVYDTSSASGKEMSKTHRLWPQTEKVRHHLLYGTPSQQTDALHTLETIRSLYLNPGAVKGLWRDKLSDDLNDIGDRSPASTLYHLINMISVI